MPRRHEHNRHHGGGRWRLTTSGYWKPDHALDIPPAPRFAGAASQSAVARAAAAIEGRGQQDQSTTPQKET